MEQLSQHFVTVCSVDLKQSKTDNIRSMLEIHVTALISKSTKLSAQNRVNTKGGQSHQQNITVNTKSTHAHFVDYKTKVLIAEAGGKIVQRSNFYCR